MKILTYHLIKEFIKPFLFSLLLLSIIVLVSELFDKLDTFLANRVSMPVIIRYFIAFIPVSIFKIIPIATLLGILFSVSDFAQKGEYTAVRSTGINPMHIIFPLIITGFILSTAVLAGNDIILPNAMEKANRIYNHEIRKLDDYSLTHWFNLVLKGHDGRLFIINHYDYDKLIIKRVTVNIYHGDELSEQIDAEEMSWDRNELKWAMKNGTIRKFFENGTGISCEKQFIAYFPEFSEKPEDLIPREKKPEEMKFLELKEQIEKLKSKGFPCRKELVELHMKISYPMANLIVVLIGIPFALTVKKSGKMLNFGFALIISFVYWTLISFGKNLGESGALPPAGAAWLANIVYLAIGSFLTAKIKK